MPIERSQQIDPKEKLVGKEGALSPFFSEARIKVLNADPLGLQGPEVLTKMRAIAEKSLAQTLDLPYSEKAMERIVRLRQDKIDVLPTVNEIAVKQEGEKQLEAQKSKRARVNRAVERGLKSVGAKFTAVSENFRPIIEGLKLTRQIKSLNAQIKGLNSEISMWSNQITLKEEEKVIAENEIIRIEARIESINEKIVELNDALENQNLSDMEIEENAMLMSGWSGKLNLTKENLVVGINVVNRMNIERYNLIDEKDNVKSERDNKSDQKEALEAERRELLTRIFA